MPKRAHESTKPSRSSRQRPTYNYKGDLRRYALNRMLGVGKGGVRRVPVSPEALSDEAGMPSARQLYRWLKVYREKGVTAPLHGGGRRALLSTAAILVVVGYVLQRSHLHLATTGEDVALFVLEAFSVMVSKEWVSRTLRQHGIRSHASHAVKWQYQSRLDRDEAVAKQRALRQLLRETPNWDDVVAYDEVGVWPNGVVQRTYTLVGRYVLRTSRRRHAVNLLTMRRCA